MHHRIAPASPDDRFDILAAAAAGRRRNAPLWAAATAAAVLLLALLLALSAYSSYAGARTALARAKQNQALILARIDQLRALENDNAPDRPAAHDPYPSFASDMQRLASQHGIQNPPIPETVPNAVERNGVREQRFRMLNVRAPSAAALIGFLGDALDTVPGLAIHELTLSVAYRAQEPTGWTMQVTFTRLEKAR